MLAVKFNSGVIFIFIFFISFYAFSSTGNDIGIPVFLKKEYDRKVIARVEVKSLNSKILSKRWTLISSLKFKNLKTYYGNTKSGFNFDTADCKIISDYKMVAPSFVTGMDTTIDLKIGYKLVVYLGFKNGSCDIVHVSRIVDDQVIFPAYLNNKERIFNIDNFEILIQSELASLKK